MNVVYSQPDWIVFSQNGTVDTSEIGYLQWLARRAGRTPWAWAALPGLIYAGYEWTHHGNVTRLIHGYDYWLTSERRPSAATSSARP